MKAATDGGTAAPLGVYVHFPYCERVCPYCDFVVAGRARARIDHRGYADAVLAELARRGQALAGRPLASVYFGGGTPSLWEPREVGRVLEAIVRRAGSTSDLLEVTLEANPSSLDLATARALVAAGVDRLSLGVQSLDAGRLAFLGRDHDPAGARAAVEAALRSGARSVNVDLIFGVATADGVETPDEAAREARGLAALGPEHVSAYALTIEERTLFGKRARAGSLPLAPEEHVAESFVAVAEALEAQGLGHYEVSNYARPGRESRHNLGYWHGGDYLGLGCGAVGALARPDGSARRYKNETRAAAYVRAALAGEPHETESEELGPETRLRERILLGLRLEEGLDLEAAAHALGVEPWPPARRRAAAELEATGRLTREGGRLRVPRAARLYTDGIAAALF
ncbi:MAG: radical SAM family heme chaperone HemW [Myxococcales bacterium]|nr:radical SAM family heme chaperone HemW [Myxococcales bacterium]